MSNDDKREQLKAGIDTLFNVIDSVGMGVEEEAVAEMISATISSEVKSFLDVSDRAEAKKTAEDPDSAISAVKRLLESDRAINFARLVLKKTITKIEEDI